MAYAYEDDDEGEPEKESHKPSRRLEEILAHQGNLTEACDEKDLVTYGGDVCREAQLDDAERKDWKEGAERAMADAKQKREAKNYPFTNAANIKYPLLTVASIQFAARAYPALVRGDEVVLAKAAGSDPKGLKAARAQRSASYANDQLMYQCDEWEPGTDRLLHVLPIIGSGFRKVTWDTRQQRPRLMLGSALDVLIPMDATCADDAPRLTQIVEKFPFEVRRLIKSEAWEEHEFEDKGSDDSQKPIRYYEQLRFCDMDGDGLDEPYVMTVHIDTEKVVRIDPAFDREDLAVTEMGGVEAIDRANPWIDYSFLPDPEGGPYGVGFGQLCHDLAETINAGLNQMTDAGKLANVQGGFVSGGLGLRSGQLRIEPGQYRVLNVPADQMRNAIYTPDFKGPSPVTFQLLDLLLAAAKDITAVKDVLTGEAPSTQPATSTLALIEQGLSVFTGIHKRIYRSLRREYRAVYKLNARYLPPEKYQRFIDWQAPEPEVQGGGQPTGMPMGAPQMAPQMPPEAMESPTPEADFSLEDMDVRPIADPSQATSMQRMARANAEMQLGAGDPAIDQVELKRRAFQALGTQDVDKLFVKGTPPAVMMQMKQIEAEQQQKERELAIKEHDSQREDARFGVEQQKHADDMAMREREGQAKEREFGFRERELGIKDREVGSKETLERERMQSDVQNKAADREARSKPTTQLAINANDQIAGLVQGVGDQLTQIVAQQGDLFAQAMGSIAQAQGQMAEATQGLAQAVDHMTAVAKAPRSIETGPDGKKRTRIELDG